MNASAQKGFTLIELMIVIAIIGILAAVSMAHYSNYASRVRASAAAVEIASIKLAVNECVAQTGAIAGCDAGTNGIPAVTEFVISDNVTELTSVTDGVIRATTGATDLTGAGLTVIDTPTMAVGRSNMVWINTGSVCNTIRGFKSGTGGCL
ncbi:MAG: prepilin-type N-terminal cleavage/methylation domain-containing protein [Psychrobacter alimentarius]